MYTYVCFVLSIWKRPHTILQFSGKENAALHEFQPDVGSGCCHQQRFASNSSWKCHTCEQRRGKEGKSSHTPKLFDITISSPFAFLSSISLITWFPCSTPLKFLSKQGALHILDCCTHKEVWYLKSLRTTCKTPRRHVCKSFTSTPAAV